MWLFYSAASRSRPSIKEKIAVALCQDPGPTESRGHFCSSRRSSAALVPQAAKGFLQSKQRDWALIKKLEDLKVQTAEPTKARSRDHTAETSPPKLLARRATTPTR